MIHYFTIFFLFLLLPLSFSSASGAVEDFTTNKSLLHKDDSLIISGNVSYDAEMPFVTIQIFTPGKSSFADFNTVMVNSDGSFSAIFHAGGPTWTSDGSYSIKITYDGSMEKSIEYKKLSTTTNPPPTTEPPSNPPTTEPPSNPPPTTEPPSNPPTTEPPSNPPTTVLTTPTPKPILSFVDPEKDPHYYIDRYNNEVIYKEWFDENYSDYTIKEAVGIPESIPEWVKDNALGWAEGQTGESDFVSGIKYMVNEKIIYIPDLSPQASTTDKEAVPDWIKNNAKWWVDEQIDEDEFVNSLKFLIQEGIIDFN